MINYKYRIETGDRVEYILSDEIKIICYKGGDKSCVDKPLETDLDKILTGFEIGKNSYGMTAISLSSVDKYFNGISDHCSYNGTDYSFVVKILGGEDYDITYNVDIEIVDSEENYRMAFRTALKHQYELVLVPYDFFGIVKNN